MPTRAQLEALQDEALADDIEIQEEDMLSWPTDLAREYFEQGGAIAADPADFESERFAASLIGLPALGPSTFSMPYEEYPKAHRCVRHKPRARARLLALYGVGDTALSMYNWIEAAPAWLEVRLVELPGHGFRKDEPLPACSQQRTTPCSAAELAEQRSQLCEQLIEELLPLLDAPYAMLGFSLGALLMFELLHKLQQRGAPPPLHFFAVGRGPPHLVSMGEPQLQQLQTCDDLSVMRFLNERLHFPIGHITDAMVPRAAALFRGGVLLGLLPHGTAPRSAGCSMLLWDDADVAPCMSGAWDRDKPTMLNPLHADAPPTLACPVTAVAGGDDTIWPPHTIAGWRAVTTAGLRELVIEGKAHNSLMCCPEVRRAAFAELAAAVQSKVRTC